MSMGMIPDAVRPERGQCHLETLWDSALHHGVLRVFENIPDIWYRSLSVIRNPFKQCLGKRTGFFLQLSDKTQEEWI